MTDLTRGVDHANEHRGLFTAELVAGGTIVSNLGRHQRFLETGSDAYSTVSMPEIVGENGDPAPGTPSTSTAKGRSTIVFPRTLPSVSSFRIDLPAAGERCDK